MMLVEQLYLFLCVVLACVFVSCWFHKSWTFALRFSLIVAAISVGVRSLGYFYFGNQDWSLLLFLVVMVTLHNLPGESEIKAEFAFLLSGACYSVLSYLWGFAFSRAEMSVVLKMTITFGGAGCLAVLMWVAKDYFPQCGWEHCFSDENKSMRTTVCSVFAVWGFLCMLPPILGDYSLPTCVLLCALFAGGISLVCLLIAFEQEREKVLTERTSRDELQAFMYVIRSQRHDYNFHVQTLQSLFQSENYEACRDYLSQLLRDSMDMNALLPLADPATSALIYSFIGMAADQNIQLHIDIENDLSLVATNVYETNKIIGNLLQNAIDETVQLQDKSYGIRLSIIKRGEFCLIRVSNKVKDTRHVADYCSGVSSKQGHEGIGLASIRSLAARHRGAVFSRIEEDIVYFTAKIPLRVHEEVE